MKRELFGRSCSLKSGFIAYGMDAESFGVRTLSCCRNNWGFFGSSAIQEVGGNSVGPGKKRKRDWTSIPTWILYFEHHWLKLTCKTISKLITFGGAIFAGLIHAIHENVELCVDRIGARHLWQEARFKKLCLQSSATTWRGLDGLLAYTCTWMLKRYSRIVLWNGEATIRNIFKFILNRGAWFQFQTLVTCNASN